MIGIRNSSCQYHVAQNVPLRLLAQHSNYVGRRENPDGGSGPFLPSHFPVKFNFYRSCQSSNVVRIAGGEKGFSDKRISQLLLKGIITAERWFSVTFMSMEICQRFACVRLHSKGLRCTAALPISSITYQLFSLCTFLLDH